MLVGHVTKEGAAAGPRALEHLVDTVVSFEGDRHHALRLLRAVKHRFGPTGEVGLFEMGDAGLRDVADPGPLLLGDRRPDVPGSAVTAILQGRRPLLVEVQALACVGTPGAARRTALGVDGRRLATVVAVLEARVGVELAALELFASVAGGVRSTEPATDLPLALAVASAAAGVPLPKDLVSFGEIGLAGEVRQVAGAERRLAEAGRLGFTRALVPSSTPEVAGGPGRRPGPDGGRGRRGRPAAGRPGPGWPRRAGQDRAGQTGRPVSGAADGGADAGTGLRPGAGGGAGGYDSSVVDRGSESLNAALALVAPGRPLRAGLDRILQAKRGALVVVGDDAAVLSICTGGFLLDAEFSPQRLSELAKMDGAIILTPDASRIARANVHLVPKASIPTTETGTRHRTAERVARSIEVPVITVSESMATVAVYRGAAQAHPAADRTARRPGVAGRLRGPALQGPFRRRAGHAVDARGRGHCRRP